MQAGRPHPQHRTVLLVTLSEGVRRPSRLGLHRVGGALPRSQTLSQPRDPGLRCDGSAMDSALSASSAVQLAVAVTTVVQPKARFAFTEEATLCLCASVVKLYRFLAYPAASSDSSTVASLSLSKDDGGVAGGCAVSGSQPPPSAR